MQQFENAQVKKEKYSQNLLHKGVRNDEAIQIPELLKEYEYRIMVAALSVLIFLELLALRNKFKALELL